MPWQAGRDARGGSCRVSAVADASQHAHSAHTAHTAHPGLDVAIARQPAPLSCCTAWLQAIGNHEFGEMRERCRAGMQRSARHCRMQAAACGRRLVPSRFGSCTQLPPYPNPTANISQLLLVPCRLWPRYPGGLCNRPQHPTGQVRIGLGAFFILPCCNRGSLRSGRGGNRRGMAATSRVVPLAAAKAGWGQGWRCRCRRRCALQALRVRPLHLRGPCSLACLPATHRAAATWMPPRPPPLAPRWPPTWCLPCPLAARRWPSSA